MKYKYYRHGYSDLDPVIPHRVLRKATGLYRINDFDAEIYKGSGNWELDESGDVAGAVLLGMDGITEYDEITETEVEALKQQLFPETG